jgi:hypothetical protein
MNRLEKVLKQKGIIYEADEFSCMRGAEYDEAQYLIDIDYKSGIIITEYDNAVLPSEFRIYDARTLNLIGGQQINRETCMWSWGDIPFDLDALEFNF